MTMPLPRRDATARPPELLRPLFDRLARLALEGRTGDAETQAAIPLDALRSAVEALAIDGSTVRADLGDVVHIHRGRYVRTLVFAHPDVEVLVMAWLPGQQSPIHDHAGSACVVRVLAGRAVERRFERSTKDDRDDAVRAVDERSFEAGSTTASFDADIHLMGNAVAEDAEGCSLNDILVTLHVYAPPLKPTRKYPMPSA